MYSTDTQLWRLRDIEDTFRAKYFDEQNRCALAISTLARILREVIQERDMVREAAAEAIEKSETLDDLTEMMIEFIREE